jgi:signal transduction histidine kinase
MTEKSALEWLAARGVLAAGVARELAAPLEQVYGRLAKTVERLDRHVSSSRGPEPLPWQTVGEIRERIADVYMEIGRVQRVAASLAAIGAEEHRELDVNEVVERALALARHRFSGDGDALLDLGDLPSIRGDGARLTQAITLILVHAADAVGSAGTVTLRTGTTRTEVVVTITASADAAELPFATAIGEAVAAERGRLEVRSSPFEVTLALPRA